MLLVANTTNEKAEYLSFFGMTASSRSLVLLDLCANYSDKDAVVRGKGISGLFSCRDP